MKKENIVHFRGYSTRLKHDEFVEQWTEYNSRLNFLPDKLTLLQKISGEGMYNYLSMHSFSREDFNFSEVAVRGSQHFPERKARVLQLGGYYPVQKIVPAKNKKPGSRVIVYLDHDQTDLEFRKSELSSIMNIYEAFYENCQYGFILEFLVNRDSENSLLTRLAEKTGKENISLFTGYSIHNNALIQQ